MTGYPTLAEIEIAWRKSGTGICVIVEGETELEDVWFYKQWFGNRAREVSFFPQNGAERVEIAVAALRASLGAKQVYGIIDRDFTTNATYPPFPNDGILRTQKYTLENYLLDPKCWFEYIRPHTRRAPKPGWNTVEEAKATIESLYRECLPVTAYNWTLWKARNEDYVAFKALPETDKSYKEHPKALIGLGDLSTHFRQMQAQMGLRDYDLAERYADLLKLLQSSPLASLETVVSGKYVLKLLQERFPLKLSGKQAWDDVLGAYIDICPDPPEDLARLIDLILQQARS